MEENQVSKAIEKLKGSPIRKELSCKELTLFEAERSMIDDIDKVLQSNLENLDMPLKIVVLGEVKAGKSTLVNALLGKKVSWTNVVEATAAIMEVKYSKQERIVVDYKEMANKVYYSLNDLQGIMNLNADQEAARRIRKITVYADTERLKEITLVDTPGLNTVTGENAERTENYVAKADVILWVMNAHHLGQKDVSEKIEEVLDYGKPLICVLNRVDEVDGTPEELKNYVQNEMGYMFTEIFTTSAQKAWEGIIERDPDKTGLSNIASLYEYLVTNVERKADQVQKESILKSTTAQLHREMHVHRSAQKKIDEMMSRFNEDLKELGQFNMTLKQIINNRLTDWFNNEFFTLEKRKLRQCENDKLFMEYAQTCTSESYINGQIKEQYDRANEYILDEWRNYREQFIKKMSNSDLVEVSGIHVNTERPHDSSNELVDGATHGGVTGVAVGLALAGYAAWLGPAAAYISIGSAIGAFFPPLLLAGAMGGVAYKWVSGNKGKQTRNNQAEDMVREIKNQVRNNVLPHMKRNLHDASDFYHDNSSLMLMSILEQCNTSKEEVEELRKSLDRYIENIEFDLLGQDTDIIVS